MGWLRDQMFTAETPIKSFGDLARRSLESEIWPRDLPLKPRSLSSLFSKLDREIELDWLLDRPEVQQVLAELFKRPVADIRAAIGPSQLPGTPHLFRLYEARFAQDVHLLTEELPPGLPSHWGNPYEWGCLHIQQTPHRGLELLTAYLSARGRAHVLHFIDRPDLQNINKRGPLCLVHHGEGPLPESLQDLHTEQRPIMLISPASTPAYYRCEREPALQEFLNPLIDWFAKRLDENSHFKAERAETWLTRELEEPAPTWSEVLSVLGTFDELPQRSIKGLTAPELGQRLIQTRLREHADRTSWGPNMVQHAWSRLLLALERGAFTQRPASLEQWGQWLSKRHQPEDAPAPDEEWMQQALNGSLGKSIKQRDLARAARRLDPSGYQLAQALLKAHLLRPVFEKTQEQVYQINSAFISRCLKQDYAREALFLECSTWGKQLLNRESNALRGEIFQRAQRGDESFISDFIDSFNESDAGCVAAFESILGHYIIVRLQTHGALENFLSQESIESLNDVLKIWSKNVPLHEPYFCSAPDAMSQVAFQTQFLKSDDQHKSEAKLQSPRLQSPTLMPSRPAIMVGALILRIADANEFPLRNERDCLSCITLMQELIATGIDDNVSSLTPFFALLKKLGAKEETTFSWLKDKILSLEAFIAFSSIYGAETGARAHLWALLKRDDCLEISSQLKTSPASRQFWEEAPRDALLHLMEQRAELPYELILPHQQLFLLRKALAHFMDLSPKLAGSIPEHALEIEFIEALESDSFSLTHHLFQAHVDVLLQVQTQALVRLIFQVDNRIREKFLNLIIKSKHFFCCTETLLQHCANKEKISLWSPESLSLLYSATLSICRLYSSESAYKISRQIEELLAPGSQKISVKDFS